MLRWLVSVWFFLICFLALIILTLATLPKPNVLVSASLSTETVALTVRDPEENTLRLAQASLSTDTMASACVTDMVARPEAGTIIYYTRNPDGSLTVSVTGAVSWRASNRDNEKTDFLQLTVAQPDIVCSETDVDLSVIRLPVAGAMTAGIVAEGAIGTEEASSFLLGGSLDIYGRGVSRVLIFPVNLFGLVLPVEANKLYYAGSFSIPPGSAFGSVDARWWGFADVDLSDKRSAIRIEASTNASSLTLQAPASFLAEGSGPHGLKPDTISLTTGARLSNDPNLRWLFAAVSFLFAFLSLIVQLKRSRT